MGLGLEELRHGSRPRLGFGRSRPGVAVLDDLDLGLGFCAADLSLGWWSHAGLVLQIWFCQQR